MKRVLYLIPSLGMGGAEVLVANYAINLDKNIFSVVIVTTGPSTNSLNEELLLKHNIKVIFLGDIIQYNKRDCAYKKLYNKIKRIIFFRKILKKEEPDIVHTHLGINEYLLGINFKKRNIKLYHTLHSDLSYLFRTGLEMYKKSTKYLVHKQNMILIALHENMMHEANQLFNSQKCMTLNNAIDIKKFSNPQFTKNEIKESLNIPKSSFIIGHVGRFSKSKNHIFLIDLFNNILEIEPSAVLILIGNGELKETIKERIISDNIEDKVYLLGNRSDIPELMSIMDVFIFPSKFEGFGNVLLESQAAGIKTITSKGVPIEVKKTNLISFLSLHQPIEDWVKEAISPIQYKYKDYGLIEYDINTVISKLQNHYLS